MPRSRRPSSTDPPTSTWPRGAVLTTTGTVRVEAEPGRPTSVTVYVNDVPSSHLDLCDPGYLAFEYMQQMAVFIDALPTGPIRAVHLGAAGCSLARYIDFTRPGSRQIAVDIDDRLISLMRQWFDLPRAPRLRIRPDDARHAVTTLTPAWADLVIRDVFADDVTPAHLTTVEFARLVRGVLRPGGLYLANSADRPPLALARAELATLAAAWSDAPDIWSKLAVATEPAVFKGRRYGNVVLAAVEPGSPDPLWEKSPSATSPGLPGGWPEQTITALARALRSLPVPAQVLTGAQARAFAGSAAVLHDAAPPPAA